MSSPSDSTRQNRHLWLCRLGDVDAMAKELVPRKTIEAVLLSWAVARSIGNPSFLTATLFGHSLRADMQKLTPVRRACVVLALLVTSASSASARQAPIDWPQIQAETIRHFRALVQIDTQQSTGQRDQSRRVPDRRS